MNKIRVTAIVLIWMWMSACYSSQNSFDASGSFEAEETIISAEETGVIKELTIEEGQPLKIGQTIGYIDTTQLYLKKRQLKAQINSLISKKPNIHIQLAALNQQLKMAENEKSRITNLLAGDAATQKQLDDVNATIEVIKKQIEAQKSSLEISSEGIGKDTMPLVIQIEQLNNQLKRSIIINPINGTVLAKYTQANEMATMGKPLYKIADLSNMILRAYISGNQLPQVKYHQKVKVYTDNGEGKMNETVGVVTWISDKAEFTPKSIQTKEERANMVYAIKVKVQNTGAYKIGMYGEIQF